ncbi:MAG TPA: C1 family peptidase [Puia sp.]|nr:C1 family peptidase [Puia sp.]
MQALARITFFLLLVLVLRHGAAQNRRYFTGDNTDSAAFSKILKSPRRISRGLENLPSSASIKSYAPVPGDQGKHGTCVAWSTAYAARTISYCIQHNITDPDKIKMLAFSPTYLYFYVRPPGDLECLSGARIEAALKALTDTGDVLQTAASPDCVNAVSQQQVDSAKKYSIKAYTSINSAFGSISRTDVTTIKKCISEKKPVIISIKCLASLFNVGADGEWKSQPNEANAGSHAVCIVGYDDQQMGGAFEVMNSWGTEWGNHGFFWLTYDQTTQYGSYALELMDREVYDGAASRGLGGPRLMGNLDFMQVDDSGHESNPIRFALATHGINQDDSAAKGQRAAAYHLATQQNRGLKYEIKLSSNTPAFVFVLLIDSNRRATPLFPSADNISPAVNSGDAVIYLPADQNFFVMDSGSAAGNLCVIYSKSQIDFQALKARLSAGSQISAALADLYGIKVIPRSKINFRSDRVSFAVKALEDQLVYFFVHLRN